MSNHSAIEWTEATWNPVRGCTKVSPGCAHCYAETFAERWRGIKGHPYEQGFDLRLVPEKLTEPLSWKKPRLVFVNSMSDLFHDDVPEWFIAQVYSVMETAHWHTFQILTKRSKRRQELLSHPHFPMLVRKVGYDGLGGSVYRERGPYWQQNQWEGVSVENKAHGLPRVDDLLKTPATVRFLSIEPLLEDLGDIRDYLTQKPGIDWVIIGGESGAGARRFDIEWAQSIVRQCKQTGVRCFVKQLGANAQDCRGRYHPDAWPWTRRAGTDVYQMEKIVLKDPKGGNPDEWPEDLRVREFPEVRKAVPA